MAVSTGLLREFNVLFSLSSSADGTWCNKNPKPGGEKLDKFEESVSQVSLTLTVDHKLMHIMHVERFEVLRSLAIDQ